MSYIKEPFVHFALLGVAIFAWFALATPESEAEADPGRIVVDQRLVETLVAQFKARMNRAPTVEETAALSERYVRDEVLVREARELGLDQGDGIVRNRLVQKMGFLMTSAAQSAVPEDATLAQHIQENAERFETDARVSFVQVGLAEGLDEAGIAGVLAGLRNGDALPESRTRLLPEVIEGAAERLVDGTFGRGFFAQVAALPVGAWGGPVQSGFGLHLVRLDALEPATVPPLDDIREDVLFDWRRTLAEQLSEAQLATLMEGYEIETPSPEDLEGWVGQ